MPTIVWRLLSDPNARYQDLGPEYHESRINKQRRQRDLIRQLQPQPDLPAVA